MITWIIAFAGVVVAAYCSAEAIGAVFGENYGLTTRRAGRFARSFMVVEILIVGLIFMVSDPNFRNSPGTIWILAAYPAAAAIFAPRVVMVTPEGLKRARFLREGIFIPWDQLDHYKVYKGP